MEIKNLLLKLRGGFGPDPYRDYNHRHRCIFIHVPKVAGNSIYFSLFNTKRAHIDLKYFEAHNSKLFSSYYKFTFVRNPYERLVSAYFYMIRNNKLDVLKNASEGDAYGFKAFVMKMWGKSLNDKIQRNVVFRPQHLFLENLAGEIALDFIGRYETLNSDFEEVRNKLGVGSALMKSNISNHHQFMKYYDSELFDIVNKIYKVDFKKLNYPMYNG